MRLATIAAAMFAAMVSAQANDRWQAEPIPTPGPVKAIDASGRGALISIGGGWFRPIVGTHSVTLVATVGPPRQEPPNGALRDGRVALGKGSIARAWLADPTDRYGHAVLGDAIEAGSVAIQRRDGATDTVRLSADAVFEDLEPRIADLGDGRERVVVVKSYLRRGAALAVIGERDGRFSIVAETPPIGTPNRWLNPAGVADFDGDGRTDIALVRMPHAAGVLELWSWRDDRLTKTLEFGDTSNHAIGSRVLRMAQVADFDGDGHPDLAIPSFDRRELRIVAFAPRVRDIARVRLPARVTSEIAVLNPEASPPGLLLALENGSLVAIRRLQVR